MMATESENDIEIPPAGSQIEKSKKEFVWTQQATWLLVRTRLSMDSDFNRPVCKMKKLWARVAEKVTAKLKESGEDVSVRSHECDSKWRNMLSTYRKNAEKAKRLGAHIVHWEFFHEMHDVLGKSSDELDGQRKDTLNGSKLATLIASKKYTPILPTPPVPPTPLSSRPPQDVLQLYLELQERKMDLWMQQKALEERKIEAINNLARAISSLAEDRNTQSPNSG
ncbi:uncharacterized protein LOC118220274 isoform X2 [Anguilla anguilla]|uniref:uncharacterized protein LOC118220274 isoform X2 n=1 Tax=Anguilla anguilla TaxID=7936 RepID=UPI0015AABE14|nr:uncharacterized protein LOC118220274 isoform X2 [Anguilla anguilla]